MRDNDVAVYLAEFRSALTGMTLAEREDIVGEIRAHIRDRAAESGLSTAEVLDRLGSATALANDYSSGSLLQRASVSFSPWLILRAAFRWSLTGIQGLGVFFVALLGYCMGVGFLICAALKPLFPDEVGMWVGSGDFNVGFRPGDIPVGREVLGPWFIPVATIAGAVFTIVTTIVVRALLPKLKRMRDRARTLHETVSAV
jgi:hypothetical protein